MKDNPGRILEWFLILYLEVRFQLITLSENLKTMLPDLSGNLIFFFFAHGSVHQGVNFHFRSTRISTCFKKENRKTILSIAYLVCLTILLLFVSQNFNIPKLSQILSLHETSFGEIIVETLPFRHLSKYHQHFLTLHNSSQNIYCQQETLRL